MDSEEIGLSENHSESWCQVWSALMSFSHSCLSAVLSPVALGDLMEWWNVFPGGQDCCFTVSHSFFSRWGGCSCQKGCTVGTRLSAFRRCSQNSHLLFHIVLKSRSSESRKECDWRDFPVILHLRILAASWFSQNHSGNFVHAPLSEGKTAQRSEKRCYEPSMCFCHPCPWPRAVLGPENSPCSAPNSPQCPVPAQPGLCCSSLPAYKDETEVPTGITSVVAQLFVIKPYMKSFLFMGNLALTFSG